MHVGGMARLALLAVGVLASGCFLELSGSYYPKVEGGERVANKGYGFGIQLGVNLKFGRVRGQFGKGGEVAAADYQDATGEGKVGHFAAWHARGDVEVLHLVDKLWASLSVGGNWGGSLAAIEYENSMLSEAHNNPAVKASAWSLFAGPSLHADLGLEGDMLFTVAPIMMRSKSRSQDDFAAYGVTGRLTFGFILPKGSPWSGWRVWNLFRRGHDPAAAQRSLQRDMSRHNRGQGQHNDRARDRERQRKKEKQRKCRERGDC